MSEQRGVKRGSTALDDMGVIERDDVQPQKRHCDARGAAASETGVEEMEDEGTEARKGLQGQSSQGRESLPADVQAQSLAMRPQRGAASAANEQMKLQMTVSSTAREACSLRLNPTDATKHKAQVAPRMTPAVPKPPVKSELIPKSSADRVGISFGV